MNPIELDTATKKQIQAIEQSSIEKIARRARLILAYVNGMQTFDAARVAGLSRGRARYWKREFNKRGIAIFASKENRILGSVKNKQPIDRVVGKNLDNDLGIESQGAVIGIERETKGKQKQRKRKKIEFPELAYPEPIEATGLMPNDTLAEAGRKVLLAQFAEMLQHEEGTRLGENIDSLHDMRVATRRMRAAFDVFRDAFVPKIIKPHLNGLRVTGRLLGSVRDLDVFMDNAQGYLNKLPVDAQNGLDPLLKAWQNQLDEARTRLIVYLDSQDYQEFKMNFNTFVQSPGFGSVIMSENIPVPKRVCEIAPCLIYSRLATVRAYEGLVNSASIPQLHALRIEFKKLRYTLEFFSEVLGTEAKQVVDLIKRLQDHLGDLHDADVACQILNSYLESWDKGQMGLQLNELQNPEPIVNYLGYQYAERHRLSVTFPDAWARFVEHEIMEKLAMAISVL